MTSRKLRCSSVRSKLMMPPSTSRLVRSRGIVGATHELCAGDGVHESALGDITVRQAAEWLGRDARDRRRRAKPEEVHCHVHVAERRLTADQARALGGDSRDSDGHILDVVGVFEGEHLAFARGHGERVALTRCGSTVALALWWAG